MSASYGVLEKGSVFSILVGGRAALALALTSTSSLCLQRAKSVKVECTVPSPHARVCIVGHPVFQAGAKVSVDPQ